MRTKILMICLFALCKWFDCPGQNNPYSPLLQDKKMWVTDNYDYTSVAETIENGGHVDFLEGDTVINGVTWKRLYSNRSRTEDGFSYYAAIRQEGSKVYIIGNNQTGQNLLYDFNIQPQESVRCVQGDINYILEDDEEYNGWYRIMTLQYIDTINVQDVLLRRYVFESQYLAKSVGRYPTLVWVEGIGSEGGLLYPWSKEHLESTEYLKSKVTILFDGLPVMQSADFYKDNVATKISNPPHCNNNNESLHDIQGRPVNAGKRNGFLIQNRKKYLVR